MFLALTSDEVQSYGVFGAMVAVAGMIVSTVFVVTLLWRGPVKGWEVPEQAIFANRLVILPSAFTIVIGFFYARPATLFTVLITGGILTAVSVVFGIQYAGQKMRFHRYKEVPTATGTVRQVPVLAGYELTDWAKAAMKSHGLTEQQCFKGTPHDPYNVDQMWTLPSRVRVYKRLMWAFIVTVFCGTGALAWLAYGVEVKVAGKAASEILNPSQVPTG
jgi:hypothetical protein